VLYLSVCFCVFLLCSFLLFFVFVRVLINNQIFHSSFLNTCRTRFQFVSVPPKRQNFICHFILIRRFHPQLFVTLVPNYGSTASSFLKKKKVGLTCFNGL